MAMKITGRIARMEHVEFADKKTGELIAFERITLFDGVSCHTFRVPDGVTYEVDEDLAALMADEDGLTEIPVEAREFNGVTTFRHLVPEPSATRRVS